MALHMGLVSEVQDVIAGMAQDEDQYIRLEAVRILGICPTAVSGEVLRQALDDSRALVQEAAERGLIDLTLEGAGTAPVSGNVAGGANISTENLVTT